MLSQEQREQVERLFTQYGKGVGGYVLTRVGNADAAEGLTARVFLTVADKFGQCRGSPVPWLWSIVRSEIARYFRDRKSAETIDAGAGADLADPAPAPPQEAERRELRDRLRAALERLPEEQHRLVYLKFFLDMPNTDIAAACGLSASNVGVIVFRALRQLKKLLDAPIAPAAAGGTRDKVPLGRYHRRTTGA